MKGVQPEQLARDGSEHGHQAALFCWFAQNFELYPELRAAFAIPNGGERSKIGAARLKAEGVRKSIPDIFIPAARGRWHGLFVEMKRPKGERGPAGRPEDEQLAMIDLLRNAGYGAIVCVGWIEARDVIIQYLNWSKINA